MRRSALILVFSLLGAPAAAAQELPEGTFASSAEGCDKLKLNTAVELGADLDFYILSRTGIAAHLQRCDFVGVVARDPRSWLATAFCDESGYVYPDLFAIAQKEDGRLAVTRSTDLTQQEGLDLTAEDPELANDMNPIELGQDESATAGMTPEEDAGFDTGNESFNVYIRCEDVKR